MGVSHPHPGHKREAGAAGDIGQHCTPLGFPVEGPKATGGLLYTHFSLEVRDILGAMPKLPKSK